MALLVVQNPLNPNFVGWRRIIPQEIVYLLQLPGVIVGKNNLHSNKEIALPIMSYLRLSKRKDCKDLPAPKENRGPLLSYLESHPPICTITNESL